MPPNGTTSTVSISPDTSNKVLKPIMDATGSLPTDLTPTSSTTTARALLDMGPQQPLLPSNKNVLKLNMKCEADRRRTYERWPVHFMDTNSLSAAGFYYTNQGDMVRCAFCGVCVGRWEEGDDPIRDHQRWSPSCEFIRRLIAGNIHISSGGQPGTSSLPSSLETHHGIDVCGPYLELRPHSGPEREIGMNQSLLTSAEMQKHGINQCRGPQHPHYNTYDVRVESYESWPRSLKQKPDKLSEAGFYYTGKGDHTVCYHCGGGLKDWEETDDPWVEHAAWFPKCMHVVLIKGQAFIEECQRQKEAKGAVKEQKDPGETQKSQASDSSTQSVPQALVCPLPVNNSEEKVVDDARLCQICFVEERGVVFLPCGHLVACVKCAPSLSTCAVCRQPLLGTVRAFLS